MPIHERVVFVQAVTGTLLTILGLRATMTFSAFGCKLDCRPPSGKYDLFKHFVKHCTWGEEEICVSSAPEMVVFWILGFLLNGLAILLQSKPGRKFVIAITNSLSKSIGVEYKMHDETLVVKPWHTPTPGLRGEPGEMSSMAKFFTTLADTWARFNALTDPKMQKDLRCMGTWKKKDTYGMFYGDFNHNGAIWAAFLMFKNLMVGAMLTTCEATMCSVPCECGADAEFKVSAPLLGVDGKVWTVAMLYVIEFLVLAFFSPDNDLINGYKMAFQQMQQSIVMLVAALTATSKISAESGAGVLVLLGTIQVALAMPEQIMGVISNFILKKGDKQSAPSFAMTPAELDLQEELAVGFQKKISSAKQLVTKVMDLKPHMLAGDVEEVFRCILMDKALMEIFNTLRPGCLNGLFGSLFTIEPVMDGLVTIKESIVILKAPIDKLLEVEWEHCVDFKVGLDALYDIKETIEVLAATTKTMMEGNLQGAVNLVMGSAALMSCLEVYDPELLRKLLKMAFQPPGKNPPKSNECLRTFAL
jgi:hypothetical protein